MMQLKNLEIAVAVSFLYSDQHGYSVDLMQPCFSLKHFDIVLLVLLYPFAIHLEACAQMKGASVQEYGMV
jgi:hypothetical protein